jgi:hypothetical protein
MNPSDASIFAVIFMVSYLPLTLMFDAVFSRQRAVLVSILLAVMFMPWVSVDLGQYLVWDRSTSVTLAVFLGVIFRDPERLTQLRLNRWDLPVLVYCFVPLISSVVNGFGLYDGFSIVSSHWLRFGGPYLIGRVFFATPAHRRDIAYALVIGAVVYVPFCIWEIRMSPNLHALIYGFPQHDFRQTMRGDSYRPMVFMQHGLMTAMWIACGALMALCLHINRDTKRIFGFGFLSVWFGLSLVLIAMQSLGAILLLLGMIFVIGYCRSTNHRWPILLLLLVPFGWASGRIASLIDSESVKGAMSFAGEDRIESLAFRLNAEDNLIANTWSQNPVVGLSTWASARTVQVSYGYSSDAYFKVDGFWLLVFTSHGIVGLLAFLMIYFVPAYSVLRTTRPRDWSSNSDHGVSAALAMVLTIVAIDNTMNAMFNPLWLVIAGALVNRRVMPAVKELDTQLALESSGIYAHVLGQPRG